MDVHWSEPVSVAVAVAAAAAVGQGRSAALECCSELMTPGGGTTPTSLGLHLEDKMAERNGSYYLCRNVTVHLVKPCS